MADPQAPQRDDDVIAYSAFNGLRSDVSPERFAMGDLAVALNVDIDKSGRLARRDGYTRQRASAHRSLWSDDMQEICLFVSGGQLNRLHSDYTAQALGPLIDVDHPMSYHRVSDRVYFSNGQDIGILENGAIRSWGLPVPPLPSVTATSGNMPAGQYQYVITWLRNDGQESGAPTLAGVINLPSGGGLQIGLPVSSRPDVVGKILYLSPPNGEVLFDAAHLDNATTSLTYDFDTSGLSVQLATQGLGPPPPGQLVTYYRGHMMVATGSVIQVSRPYAYELFDPQDYIDLDGSVALMAVLNDKDKTDSARESGFFVGTDRSCGILAGASPGDFQYVPKTDYGAILGALDYIDGSLFQDGSATARALPVWLTPQGLCIGMPDLSINNVTRTKFTFPAAGRGAALFMPGPNRIVVTANL